MNCTKVFALLVLAAGGAAAVDVNIDATRAREPISPYIYGQFIEHLGRCIYGGLWAEMLEDRKFYYPIRGEAPAWTLFTPGKRSYEGEGHPYELLTASPWMILGDKGAVRMVKENAWVGEHTPRIELTPGKPAGLQHERLALVAGKQYEGRIVLAGDPAAAPIEVSLVWGGGASDRQTFTISRVERGYTKAPFRFEAGGSTDNGRLEIVGRGSGYFLVGAVSLMPADNVHGWRADTLALLKELDAPVYRWPGGNFVSGYNWRDGIGDPDRRPPRKNPAWKGIEHNDVGIHEYIQLCRLIGAEPFIAVNTGLGTVEEAAQELEYVNGPASSPMGKLRAQNGHPEPFHVQFWAVGNEMYGAWQLGHMPLAEYVKKHNRVVEAMRAIDPTIRPIAVGQVGDWSRQMLATCADHMSLLSEHLYWQQRNDLIEHVRQIPERIRQVADAHRGYRRELPSLQGKDIRIAMDEWNYWYGPNEFGELGVRYFLQDALGIAAGLHEFFRNSDIYYMANYAQTVNVIGAIKTTKTAAELETTGLVLKLYRRHFGKTPVAVSTGDGRLDVAAAWTEDRRQISVGVVNPTTERLQIRLELQGAAWTGRGRHWVITGAHRWAHNSPGKPRAVDIEERAVLAPVFEAPPLSVNLVRLDAEPR
jgi:alpha-N-arabinofuranosidase